MGSHGNEVLKMSLTPDDAEQVIRGDFGGPPGLTCDQVGRIFYNRLLETLPGVVEQPDQNFFLDAEKELLGQGSHDRPLLESDTRSPAPRLDLALDTDGQPRLFRIRQRFVIYPFVDEKSSGWKK
jgi:hypothetical protein